MFEIVKYRSEYGDALMELIRREGEDWRVYWEEPNASKYRQSLEDCIVYLAMCDGAVCGYSRSIKDALYICVCDLLVNEKYRGHGLGRKLMQRLRDEYPGLPVYIMSGNDKYYETLGCKKEGSIYLL